MEQEWAVNKAMLWLKQQNAIPPDSEDNEIIKKHLNWMYVIGYEAGLKSAFSNIKRRHTQIQQYNIYGRPTKTYISVAEAARKNHCTTDPIFESLKNHTKTKNGFYYTRID
jgi:hypothetical protein